MEATNQSCSIMLYLDVERSEDAPGALFAAPFHHLNQQSSALEERHGET